MNPAYIMGGNGIGVRSIPSHPGPTPRGFRQGTCAGPIPYRPSVRVTPPCPSGGGMVPPGPMPSPSEPIDVSHVLEGMTFDLNSTDMEARETFAAVIRKFGGTVTDSTPPGVWFGGGTVPSSGGGGGGLAALAAALADVHVEDDATQHEVKTALQQVLRAIKAGIAALLLAPLAAFSATMWEDVSPTQTVAEAVANAMTTTLPPSAAGRGVTFVDKYGEDQNAAVEIGKGASAGVTEAQLASAASNAVVRSVSVAIGAQAEARDPDKPLSSQSIAIGFHSQALGSQAIAIGSGARHPPEQSTEEDAVALYGVATNVGDNAVAKAGAIAMGYAAKATGNRSIALGYEAEAPATGAVQLGTGRNSEANTLKFQDVAIVRNGRLALSGDAAAVVLSALDPAVVTNGGYGADIQVQSHAITSVVPGSPVCAGCEIVCTPTGSRNFQAFIANTPEAREGLPCRFSVDFAATSLYGPWDTPIVRLPVMATFVEPVPGFVKLTIEEFADGYDWTPVVVDAYLTNDEVRVTGTNLQFAAFYSIGLHGGSVTNFPYAAVRSPLYRQLKLADTAAAHAYEFDADYPDATWHRLYVYDAGTNLLATTQVLRYPGVGWRWTDGAQVSGGDEMAYRLGEPVWDDGEATWLPPAELPGEWSLLSEPGMHDPDAAFVTFTDGVSFVSAERASAIEM